MKNAIMIILIIILSLSTFVVGDDVGSVVNYDSPGQCEYSGNDFASYLSGGQCMVRCNPSLCDSSCSYSDVSAQEFNSLSLGSKYHTLCCSNNYKFAAYSDRASGQGVCYSQSEWADYCNSGGEGCATAQGENEIVICNVRLSCPEGQTIEGDLANCGANNLDCDLLEEAKSKGCQIKDDIFFPSGFYEGAKCCFDSLRAFDYEGNEICCENNIKISEIDGTSICCDDLLDPRCIELTISVELGGCPDEETPYGDGKCCPEGGTVYADETKCCSPDSKFQKTIDEEVCCDETPDHEFCIEDGAEDECPPSKQYGDGECCENGVVYNQKKGCCDPPNSFMFISGQEVCCADTPDHEACNPDSGSGTGSASGVISCSGCSLVSHTIHTGGKISGKGRCTLDVVRSDDPYIDFLTRSEFGLRRVVYPDFSRIAYHRGILQINYNLDGYGTPIPCTIPASTGCDSDGANNVCPRGCRSWEDPDCNYGPYASRLWSTFFGETAPFQNWWNEQLQTNVGIGALYSGLEHIPLTVEWWTARMCNYGVKFSDEEVCDSMGMEGDCSTSWEPPAEFSGDNMAILMAAEYLTEESRYRFSWRLENMEGVKYRARVIRYNGGFDMTIAENEVVYPADKKFIPVKEGVVNHNFTRPMLYVGKAKVGFDKVCLDFEVDRTLDNFEDIIKEMADVFWLDSFTGDEPIEICRTIVKN